MHDLTLYSHPFASFCQKVLIALYETGIPFEDRVIDLSSADDRADITAVWPMGRFPVLVDRAKGVTVPEIFDHHRTSGDTLSLRAPPAARRRGCGA